MPRITIERLLRSDGDELVFAAVDSSGLLNAIVPAALWEELRLEAPDHSDADDRRDFALGMIEAKIEALPVDASGDRRELHLT